LTVKEAIDHFLVTKEKTSHFHSNDLTRRLQKWADTIDLTQPIHSFTKQEIESYLAQYSAKLHQPSSGAFQLVWARSQNWSDTGKSCFWNRETSN
jgi:hypothetical protein